MKDLKSLLSKGAIVEQEPFLRSYQRQAEPVFGLNYLVFIRKLPLPSRERGGVRGNRNERP